MSSNRRRKRVTPRQPRRPYVGGRPMPRVTNLEQRSRLRQGPRQPRPYDPVARAAEEREKEVEPRVMNGGQMLFDPKTGLKYYLPPTPSEVEKSPEAPAPGTPLVGDETAAVEPSTETKTATFDVKPQTFKKENLARGDHNAPKIRDHSENSSPKSRSVGKKVGPSPRTAVRSMVQRTSRVPSHTFGGGGPGNHTIRATFASSSARGKEVKVPRRAGKCAIASHLLVESLEEKVHGDINPSIDYRYASDVSRETEENAHRLIDQHGDHGEMWVWVPNAVKHHTRKPPSGFVFSLNSEYAPIVRDLFFPSKFNYGTLAVRIPDDLTTPDGQTILGVLRSRKLPDLKEALLSSDVIDPKLIRPGSGSFAGIYISVDREDDDAEGAAAISGVRTKGSSKRRFEAGEGGPWKSHAWILVQCGNPEVSKQIYEKIEAFEMGYKRFKRSVIDRKRKEAAYAGEQFTSKDIASINFDDETDDNGSPGPEEPTWEGAFFNGTNKVELVTRLTQIEETRFKVALNIVKMLGFTNIENTRKIRHEWLHVSTVRNTLSVTSDGAYTYYSGCTQIHAETRAVIVNESPLKGPVILKGPPTPSNPLGKFWPTAQSYGIPSVDDSTDRISSRAVTENATRVERQTYSQRPYMGFPCITGRIMGLGDIHEETDHPRIGMGLEPFTFKGMTCLEDLTKNPRLHPELYRRRGHAWKLIEQYMGHDPRWGEIQLKPFAVRVAPPPVRDVFGGITL